MDTDTKVCKCIIYHPALGSQLWKNILFDYRIASNSNDSLAFVMAYQLFGKCPVRDGGK